MGDQYESIVPPGGNLAAPPPPPPPDTNTDAPKSGKSEVKTEQTVLKTQDENKKNDKTEDEASKYNNKNEDDEKTVKNKDVKPTVDFTDRRSRYVKRMRIMVIVNTAVVLVFAIIITVICLLFGFVDVLGLFKKPDDSLLTVSVSTPAP